MNAKSTNQTIAEIAERCLDIKTLTVQNVDRLDFHELGVASLKAALEAAYEAGWKAAKAQGK